MTLARLIVLLSFISVGLTGCTLDIKVSDQEQHPTNFPLNIQFQSLSSAPSSSLIEITEHDLREGDLLFSSSIGVTSLGIRLLSTSSVSHVAIYLGQGQVAEAVGKGVQIVTLEHALAHSDKMFVLRMLDLTPQQADKVRLFAQQKEGSTYNYNGIIKMIPFMVTKQLCSLNPFSAHFRQQCVTGLAAVQLRTPSEHGSRYFCSEFVIAAFEQAGNPLTLAAQNWVSPSDLLHMRAGDISTLPAKQPLIYAGHLKRGIYLQGRTVKNRK